MFWSLSIFSCKKSFSTLVPYLCDPLHMFARAYAQIASFDPVFTAFQRSNSPEFAKINKVLEGVILIPRSCVFSQIADTYLLT